jgi:hypothetical protein
MPEVSAARILNPFNGTRSSALCRGAYGSRVMCENVRISHRRLNSCSMLAIQSSNLPMNGRAIAQTVSHRLPTTAARIRVQAWSCGICGGQSGTGAVFPEYFGFPYQFSFHRLLHVHHHLSSGAGTIR